MKSLLLLMTLALLAACGKGSEEPQDPVWGKQPCEHCKMVVGEPDYAAQMATVEGRRYWFDDIGCLVGYEGERKPKVAKRWVHAFGEPRWLPAETAVYEGGKPTPMDFGFVARATGPGVAWPEVVRSVEQKLGTRGTGHVEP